MADIFKTAGEAGREVRSTGQTGELVDDTTARMEPSRTAIAPPASTNSVAPVRAQTEPLVSPTLDAYRQAPNVPAGNSLSEASPTLSSYRSSYTPEPDPEPIANANAGLVSDTKNLLGIGVNNLALNVRELVGRIPGVGEKLVSGLDAIDKWATGQSSEDLLKGNIKQAQGQLSAEMTEAGKKDWWDSDKGTFGSAWSDPRSYYSGIVQSLPEQTITMFPPLRLAKGVYTAKLAAGASKEVASAAAARAATVAGGISEGLLAGAASSREVRDKVLEMTPEQLENSDGYRTLVLNGMSPEAARSELANGIATQAFITAGVITGAFGGMGDRLLAKAITEGVGKSVVGRVARGAVSEGVLEEFPQEYGATVAENLAMQRANPNVGAFDDALNRGLGGLATGSIQGGAMAGVLGKKAGSDAAPSNESNVTSDVTSSLQSDARAKFALTADEFKSVVQSPEYMAAAYAQADDNTRGLLQRANPELDLDTLSRNAELVAEGQQFINDNPQFFAGFNSYLATTTEKVDAQGVTDLPFDPTDDANNPAPRFTPSKANMGIAQDLAGQGVEEAEGGFSSKKPVPDNSQEVLVPGPTDTAQNPDTATLFEGYSREMRNIESVEDPARRRYLANQAMTSMIRNGFTFDDANAMFGSFLTGEQNTGSAAPTETVSERLQNFNQIRKNLIAQDKKKWGVQSTEGDYQVANLTPAIYKLAEVFGVKVVGFRYTGKDTKMARRRGMSTPDGIAINSAARDQFLTVFGHEVYHQLRNRDKAAAADLEQRVIAFIAEDAQKALRTKLENIGYSPEKITEETVADVMGVMFQDPRFWEQLGQEKPSLLQKVLRVIDDMIKRFGQMGSRSEELAMYISEMDTVRDMMADFVSQSLDKQAAQQEIDESIEISDDPVGQFRDLAAAGNKAGAAKVFNTAKLREQLGDFNTAFTNAAKPLPAPVKSAEVAAPTAPAMSAAVRKDLSQMYRERAAGAAQMTAFDQERALAGYAKDLIEYGFSDAEIADILQGESEVIDSATLKSKKVKFSYNRAAQNVGSTTRVSSDNPNAVEGTLQASPPADPQDLGSAKGTADQRVKERQKQAAQARAQYSDGVARALINQKLDPKGDRTVNSQLEYEFVVGDRAVGKVFSAGEEYFRFNIKEDGSYNYATGPNLGAMIAKPPKGATIQRVRQDLATQQTKLDLEGNKQQANKYRAEVQRIMTTAFTPSLVAKDLADLRQALADQFQTPFFKNGKDRSDVEYIFNMFADVGAIASDDVKAKNEEVDAIKAAIERLQNNDVRSRAAVLKLQAAKIDDALQTLASDMVAEGMPQQQVDEIVQPARDSLKTIEDATDPQVVLEETGNAEVNENQLDLPTKDFGDARQSAAAAVDEIVNGKQSPIAVIRRELNKPDRSFTFSDLRKEMAARGMDISEIDREVAQWPAAQYSLAYWVQKNSQTMSPYAARTAWFNSHENIMSIYKDDADLRGQYEAELSDVEKRFIEAMRKERQAVKNRRNESVAEDGQVFVTPELAFPHALFNKYRLNDMRNLDESGIAEDEANVLRSLVGGNTTFLPRLWLDDVAYAIDARKDLRPLIMDGLNEQERTAVARYLQLTASTLANNERISALRSYSTMLDNIEGLDRPAYEAFKKQIIYSDLKAIPAILQRAEDIANITTQAKDKKELGLMLSAYLDKVYQEDERSSTTLDESQAEFNQIAGRGTATVTDEDVQSYISEMTRLGANEGTFDTQSARINLMYEKAAQSAVEEIQTGVVNENETAAQETDQPENQVGLSGDIRYKRGRFSSGPAAATVQAHLAQITSSWKRQPNVQVFFNVDQISDPELRARLTERAESGAFKGAIDPNTGAVYIFSQHVEDLADAEFVLFHELYGHWGMRAFLGDKLNAFLENQYRLNKKIKAEADRQFDEAKADGSPMSRMESVEEAIADLATKGEPNLFRQLIGQLVSWLRKNNMGTVADWIDSTGSSELAHVLAAARRVARTGEGISPFNGAPSQVLYARNKFPVELFATRDDKITGYARMNPVTQYWTVFTIKDIATGDFGAITVEDLADATAVLKKVGTISKSRDRETRVEIDPNNLEQIPDTNDLVGWKKFMRNAQIKGQNMFLPIFEVARFLESKGIKSSVIQDLIMYESRLGYFVNDFEKRYANPIQRALKEAGKKGATVEDIDLYLMARHAGERNGAINAINPDNRSGSGLDTKEAKELLAKNNDGKWDKYSAELETIGKLMDQMSRDKMNYMLQTGLINKYQFESLAKYEHYVNLSGNKKLGLDAFDSKLLGGKAFNLKGSDVIRATGRGTLAVDVLQNTMNSYLSTLIRGQKNRPVMAILKMLEQNPDPTYATIEPIKEKKSVNVERLNMDRKILRVLGDAPTEASGREFLRGLQSQVADGAIDTDDALQQITGKINEAEAQRNIDPAEAATAIRRLNESVVTSARLSPDGYVSMVEDNSLMLDPSVLVAKVNGRPVVIRFTERGGEFIQAITGMNVQQSDGITEAIGKWNRFFSQMVTSWNPAWLPINFIRDIQTAFANASSDPRVGVKLANEMRKQWMPALQAAFKYTRAEQRELKGKPIRDTLAPEWRDLIDQFYKDGASTFFLDRKGLEQSLDKINRHLNGAQGVLQNTEDALEVVGDFMDLLATPSELAPRLAAYKVLLQNGWSRDDAAQYAKELTVNFNMKGSAKGFRALYVFANPAIQGTFRMFQDYSRGEKGIARYMPSNRFAATAAAWMMVSMVANMIARGIGGEDEERPGIDKLDMIPAFKRNTALVFMPDMLGGSIPIAYGWNVFAAAGTYMMDVINGKLKPEVAAMRVANAAFDSFAPIGSGAESKTLAGLIGKTIAPSPFVPIVELGTNENRFGAPIYKEQSAFSNVKEADAYMHFNSVNPISKSLMQALNSVGSKGNPRYQPGLIDVNPGVVDHMISSYLPGLFSEAYKSAGFAINVAQGRNTKDQPIPVVDRFKAKIPEGFDTGAMRRVAEQVDTVFKEFTANSTTPERRQQIVNQHPNLGAAKAIVAGVNQELRQLSSTLKEIESNPRIPEDQKIAYRNRMEEQKKFHTRRLVQAAVASGFTDEIIDNRASGFVGKAADLIRGK